MIHGRFPEGIDSSIDDWPQWLVHTLIISFVHILVCISSYIWIISFQEYIFFINALNGTFGIRNMKVKCLNKKLMEEKQVEQMNLQNPTKYKWQRNYSYDRVLMIVIFLCRQYLLSAYCLPNPIMNAENAWKVSNAP